MPPKSSQKSPQVAVGAAAAASASSRTKIISQRKQKNSNSPRGKNGVKQQRREYSTESRQGGRGKARRVDVDVDSDDDDDDEEQEEFNSNSAKKQKQKQIRSLRNQVAQLQLRMQQYDDQMNQVRERAEAARKEVNSMLTATTRLSELANNMGKKCPTPDCEYHPGVGQGGIRSYRPHSEGCLFGSPVFKNYARRLTGPGTALKKLIHEDATFMKAPDSTSTNLQIRAVDPEAGKITPESLSTPLCRVLLDRLNLTPKELSILLNGDTSVERTIRRRVNEGNNIVQTVTQTVKQPKIDDADYKDIERTFGAMILKELKQSNNTNCGQERIIDKIQQTDTFKRWPIPITRQILRDVFHKKAEENIEQQ